jgi:(1->4)-alpha-D-glucan 1-alpha-D-glucosylmutase
VYRTYAAEGASSPASADSAWVARAVDEARGLDPDTPGAVYDFLGRVLRLEDREQWDEAGWADVVRWVMAFQQLSGPVMAKGVEDTAFYRYFRLASLNEVGGHPEHFGAPLEAWHGHQTRMAARWPRTMLATATHDPKRGEDMRARLNVLSEMPEAWGQAVRRWSGMHAGVKTPLGGDTVSPSRNDEYLLYQTLVGVWPFEDAVGGGLEEVRDRVTAYMVKAMREAKVETDWLRPHAPYEEAVERFIRRLLADEPSNDFFKDFRSWQRRAAYFGQFNSLSQTLLKLMAPGVPDTYQGCELWDFSLVDPDNRRPVDFAVRRRLLEAVRDLPDGGKGRWWREEGAVDESGESKLFLVARVLAWRQAQWHWLEAAGYERVPVEGPKQDHVCAFARRRGETIAVVVAPRWTSRLCPERLIPPLGKSVWGDTQLRLPSTWGDTSWRSILTGSRFDPPSSGNPGLAVSDVLGHFPVALLESVMDSATRR